MSKESSSQRYENIINIDSYIPENQSQKENKQKDSVPVLWDLECCRWEYSLSLLLSYLSFSQRPGPEKERKEERERKDIHRSYIPNSLDSLWNLDVM